MARSVKRPVKRATGKPAGRQPGLGRKKQARPRVRAALAVSLDGYIADRRGGVAWLDPYFSPELDFAGFAASIGATIMGRKTFDAAVKLGLPPGTSSQASVVLTHRPPRRAPKGFEMYDGNLRPLIDRLRRELAGSGKDIWLMGGGISIDSFRAAGLLDRLELGVIPVLLGAGIPLFPAHSRGLEGLKRTRTRALANGIVELWYESTLPG